MVPWKFESVSVAAWATHQYTLQGEPPSMPTDKLVPVRAPVPPEPILKIQTPFEGPLSVSVPFVVVDLYGPLTVPRVVNDMFLLLS